MNRIEHGNYVYEDSDILSGTVYSEISPIAESLGYGTLEAVVKSSTPAILQYQKNSPLTYWHNNSKCGTYYVQKISRIGPQKYKISAIDAIGLLANRKHYGGIYTGETAKEVIEEICGTVSVFVKTIVKDTKLYGWLPVASRRDNLAQVLFAIGCIAKIDLNGTVRIEGLWDEISQTINKVSLDAEAEYPAPITAVKLTEHQFLASDTSELETLFEGTAAAEDIITFDEPVHSLTTTGFTIIESGANYAKVTGGTGEIKGKKYVHAKRELCQFLAESQDESEVSYEDSTLISINNSQATLERLCEFFLHQNTVQASVRQKQQQCGDVVSIVHPYDKVTVPAFIQTVEVTMSKERKAAQSYLIGYRPTMPNNVIYESIVELVSEDRQVTIPEGVTQVRAVIIGGGSGGTGGSRGEYLYRFESGYLHNSGRYEFDEDGVGCAGGQPGAPGRGGKIKVIDLQTKGGETFSVHIGQGGIGGDGCTSPSYGITDGKAGTAGGETSFGEYSSASGTELDEGFLDIYSGIVYGAMGPLGFRGGNGGGTNKGGHPGESLYGQTGGAPGVSISGHGSVAYGGGGGGCAYGSNGNNGMNAIYNGVSNFATPDGTYIDDVYLYYGGRGGNGATAIPASHATVFGCGGQGGHGGGGAGHIGGGRCATDCVVCYNRDFFGDNDTPGYGSRGGDGAKGCVILYYSKPVIRVTGRFADKNGKSVADCLGRQLVI